MEEDTKRQVAELSELTRHRPRLTAIWDLKATGALAQARQEGAGGSLAGWRARPGSGAGSKQGPAVVQGHHSNRPSTSTSTSRTLVPRNYPPGMQRSRSHCHLSTTCYQRAVAKNPEAQCGTRRQRRHRHRWTALTWHQAKGQVRNQQKQGLALIQISACMQEKGADMAPQLPGRGAGQEVHERQRRT